MPGGLGTDAGAQEFSRAAPDALRDLNWEFLNVFPRATILLALVAGGVACGHAEDPAGRAAKLRLTVIPPGVVTDKVRVEARVTIPNPTWAPREYQVEFYWDRPEIGHSIERRTVVVAPNERALVRARCPTAGRAGERRLLCRVSGEEGVREAEWPVEVVASETRAPPTIQGVWLDPLALSDSVYPRTAAVTEADVRHSIDAYHDLGVKLLIVTYVEYQGSFFYPSNVRFRDRDMKREAGGQHFAFDVVGTVLSQADRHGMRVILGLGRGGDSRLLWEFDEPDWDRRNEEALRIGRTVGRELWERYGGHASFYGWYLTHEMNDLARAAAYYNPLADFCHSLSPDTCVMVAPAGTPVITAEALAQSRVDVFAYQDAVGAGYVPYRYTYDPEQRLAGLAEVFAGYGKLHDGSDKHLWADLEVWEMDGSAGYSGAYAAAFPRVKRQLEIECRVVEMITAYEGWGFLESPGSGAKLKDPRAARLFTEYQAYLRDQHAAPKR